MRQTLRPTRSRTRVRLQRTLELALLPRVATMRQILGPSRYLRRLYQWRFRRAGLTERLLDLPDGRVACWASEADGPAVVLLEGFGASSIWQWHASVGPLAEAGFRVIVPDLLFFGESTTDRPERSLELQAEVMRQALDHLQVVDADLVGISYGGFVALLMAATWPERARRLVLVDSPGGVMTPADVAALHRRFDVDDLRQLLLPDDTAGVMRLIEVASHDAPWVPEFALADALEHLFTDHLEEKAALLADLLARAEGPTLDDLCVSHPALLLWGEHDPIFPVELGQRLARALGETAHLEVIGATAHAPNLEKPREFNRLLLEFLRRSDPP